MNDNPQPVSVHLKELQKRLFLYIVTLFMMFSISYLYATDIYTFLVKPLAEAYNDTNHKLIYTGLTEAFFTHMKIAFFSGFVLSFPMLAYQLYFFIAPGLYKEERFVILPYLFIAPILFTFGAALVYYYIMPIAWKFFLSFENYGSLPIVLEARVSEYLSLVMSLIMGFGMAFQLPGWSYLHKLDLLRGVGLLSKEGLLW
jgi:sec-independent protein translocase protein TatC